MKPLAELRGASRLRGLLFDIDDTLTTDGRLTAEAYTALERLKKAGRLAIPVTGRPAGWRRQTERGFPCRVVAGVAGRRVDAHVRSVTALGRRGHGDG